MGYIKSFFSDIFSDAANRITKDEAKAAMVHEEGVDVVKRNLTDEETIDDEITKVGVALGVAMLEGFAKSEAVKTKINSGMAEIKKIIYHDFYWMGGLMMVNVGLSIAILHQLPNENIIVKGLQCQRRCYRSRKMNPARKS